ncbi:hypothetical protein FB468_2737 [Leucobacter komagatae]|uniref:Uncharacterized protein n=1 Tax=Leucobacter komagatae TaxID=55969 RepID=A0A542Y9C3_9MICO|nr:hypothetical protein [Leucobacter komagatae]TQL44671.1 hypothetical protein FB468_2737 [Leucobacter komagatae]
MIGAHIRVFRNTDKYGNHAPEERVEPVFVSGKKLQSVTGQAAKALVAYSPSLTDTLGVYSFDDPERGSGWLRLEGVGKLALSRIHDLVRLSEIERAIGEKDPIPGAELGIAAPMAFHNRSPYVHFATGLAVLCLGVWFGSLAISPEASRMDLTLFMGCATVIVLGMGCWAIYMSIRRFGWWTRARRYALSDGGPLPEDLTYLG